MTARRKPSRLRAANAAPPAKAEAFGVERARQNILTRTNPLEGFTARTLTRCMRGFERGFLREPALLWQRIMERDDQVITCSGKRVRGTPGLNYEILTADDSDEAKTHQEALKAFYSGLTATNGLDLNERGGVRLLLRQMLSCIGLKYATHEIIWRPLPGGGYTAEFKFIPLHFFENTTGRLRFLPDDYSQYGVDLDQQFGEGGWMITVGDGLMVASSIAYLFKRDPLRSWVGFAEKYGTPGLHAKTSAPMGSKEWDALVAAVEGFGEDLAIVTNEGASINPIELKSSGNQPHPPLVDAMNRAISRIWVGGDLATMSKGGGEGGGGGAVGSKPQQDDLDKLQAEDAAMVSDTLNHYVDRRVIQNIFGTDTPRAYFKLLPPSQLDTTRELAIDAFLLGAGIPLGKKALLERYGRPEISDDDEPAVAAPKPVAPDPLATAANEAAAPDANLLALTARGTAQLAAVDRAALRPILTQLAAIEQIADPDEQRAALVKFHASLPALAAGLFSHAPAAAQVLAGVISPALISGYASAAAQKSAA